MSFELNSIVCYEPFLIVLRTLNLGWFSSELRSFKALQFNAQASRTTGLHMMSVDDCIEGEFFSEFLGNGNAEG